MRRGSIVLAVMGGWCLGIGLTGCESLERKFTRRSKRPAQAPSPIISFQDYSRAMTPLDRYRKHYLLFEYWNEELVEALRSGSPNSKRFTRASTEALAEMEVLTSLVTDDLAARLAPLVEARAKVNRQLQSRSVSAFQATAVLGVLESQTRQIEREFFWRDVQDSLKEQHPETTH